MTLLEAPPLTERLPVTPLAEPTHEPDRHGLHPAVVARRLAGVAVSIIALVVFGIFCVTPDGTGFLQAVDTRLSATFDVATWRPTGLSTALGSPIVVIVASIAAVALLWRPRQSLLRRCSPVAITAGAGLIAWLIGTIVGRPSPGHLGDLTASNATSFPSVGAAMATGLAIAAVRTLSPEHRRVGRVVVAIAVAAAVPMVVRLSTDASWPLDEAAGVLVGAVAAHLGAPTRSGRRAVTRRRRGRLVATGCLVLVVCLVPVGRSYARMLTAPGSAPFDERSVEWLRDNGMTALVDRGESWWLWRHLPSPTAMITELPGPPVARVGPTDRTVLPASVRGPILPALAGEGQWSVVAADAAGAAQIATTYFRPDPAHPSLVAAAAWINAATTKVTLIAGTRQPGGGPGPAGARVPVADRSALVAVFNSGYKMKDTPGGALMEGRTTRHMVDGLATLAIRPDGTATVGAWGTDVPAHQGYVGLRQNLHLMVEGGAVVDGVTTNAGGRWGTVRNTLPTWRSGLGVTASGNLVYVAGNNLTLGVLAAAMVESGTVTAMELDIHRGMVTFNVFTRQPDLVGHKLIPDMSRPADRYLTADWRDFVMVTSR